jgi:hypothetical protein
MQSSKIMWPISNIVKVTSEEIKFSLKKLRLNHSKTTAKDTNY